MPVNIIKTGFRKIYFADGVDLIKETVNGQPMDARAKKFAEHPLSTITTFLGLPNRKLESNPKEGETGQSWLNVGRNFIGWQEHASFWRSIINGFLMLSLNAVTWPFKFSLNIIKLFSIVLPGMIADLIPLARLALVERTGSKALGLLLYIPQYAFKLTSWASMLLFTPFQLIHKVKNLPIIRASKWLRYMTVALVIYVIFMVNIIILPFAVHALAVALAPYLATHLPIVLVNGFNLVAAALTPTLNVIGHIFITLNAFGNAALSTMPALVALLGISSVGFASIGAVVSDYVEEFREYWHRKPGQSENSRSSNNLIEDAFRRGEFKPYRGGDASQGQYVPPGDAARLSGLLAGVIDGSDEVIGSDEVVVLETQQLPKREW